MNEEIQESKTQVQKWREEQEVNKDKLQKKEIINTPEEAKYWRDKHVIETEPTWHKDTMVTVCGVDPDNYDKIKADKEKSINKKKEGWNDLYCIDAFLIYEGSEKIYDIIIDGKKIRLEGKEIMDYNIFRLRYFETFGIMLPTFKGIMESWAILVTNWNKNYGKILQEKTEDISESDEAKQLIIDYINNCSITESYIIKEGIITLRESFIYVPTKIIKKILKRESINISLRKLAYLLDDYIASGSIPFKIENRSERFWKFYACKFDIKDKTKLEVEEENGE